jgi:uncharacterized phage-associated protein
MATCFEVADYFIANADQDEGVANMKLQKLCSYAQGFSLALRDKPMFDDVIEAWTHGPVVPKLYERFRACGKNPIQSDTLPQASRLPFSDEELFVLETVNNYFGRFSASELRNMSHIDFPGDFNAKEKIPASDIRARFEENKIIKNIKEVYDEAV